MKSVELTVQHTRRAPGALQSVFSDCPACAGLPRSGDQPRVFRLPTDWRSQKLLHLAKTSPEDSTHPSAAKLAGIRSEYTGGHRGGVGRTRSLRVSRLRSA